MHDEEKSKEELRNFLDSMVDDNPEQAQVHFHNYLEDRVKGIVNPQVDVEISDEDSDSKEDEGSSDKE